MVMQWIAEKMSARDSINTSGERPHYIRIRAQLFRTLAFLMQKMPMSQLPIFRQSSSPISPSLVPPFGFLVPASYLASCEDGSDSSTMSPLVRCKCDLSQYATP